MPGFYVSNITNYPLLNNAKPDRCASAISGVSNYSYARNTLNKFMADKLFDETEQYVLILEGVVLNKVSLMKQFAKGLWLDTVLEMIRQEGETFFGSFEGPFSGAVYDKDKQQWIFFTNQTGETPLFYYQDTKTNQFIVASQVNYILDNIEKKNLHLDKRAAVDMLTFAYMEGSETYAKEIKRLIGGGYIIVSQNNQIELKTYHTFTKKKYNLSQMSTADIIDQLDEKFRNAVKMEFDKDIEYGYSHLVDLSGGLDSRMTSWVAHSMGYIQQQNITYCQANTADEVIAKQIAADLHHELLVKPLDDISFMYDAQEIVEMNNGLSLYCGITGGNRLLNSLNMNEFGIEHTGMIGDVVIGSFLKKKEDLFIQTPEGMYSNRYANEVKNEYHKHFEDHEQYLLYVRGFHGACATHMIRTNYTATWSPFLNTDFFEFCLCIPIELRCKHFIYKKWILAKYPQAADYVWEKTGLKITAGNTYSAIHKIATKGPAKLSHILGIRILSKKGMNPMDYWYHNSIRLQKYFEQIFTDGIDYGIIDNALKKQIEELFRAGSCMEKAQVVTLLIALQWYFGDRFRIL